MVLDIYLRNVPNASWTQIKQALTLAFQSNVSDAAIRRLIADRLQRNGERFMEFVIAIQELEVRLGFRMSEFELLETLRRNMLPHIQDRLLFVTINSVAELQNRVHQVEELAQRQSEVQQVRRSVARVHEIAALPCELSENRTSSNNVPHSTIGVALASRSEVTESHVNPFSQSDVHPGSETSQPANEQTNWMCAMMASQTDKNQDVSCWNCDEEGHTFMDCAARRIIFCYGCGTKNVVRPQCLRCSSRFLQGNGRRNVRPPGLVPAEMRIEGQTFQTIRQPHRPN